MLRLQASHWWGTSGPRWCKAWMRCRQRSPELQGVPVLSHSVPLQTYSC